MSLCIIRFHIVQYRFHNMMVSQSQSKSVRRSLTRHRYFVYMCLVPEGNVLVDIVLVEIVIFVKYSLKFLLLGFAP